MPREKSKLWAVWLLGVVVLIIGVAFIAYHVKDLPYTLDYIGLGGIMGLIGFLILIGATAYIEGSGKTGTTSEHARPTMTLILTRKHARLLPRAIQRSLEMLKLKLFCSLLCLGARKKR